MYRTTQTSPSSISHDFITFGHEALAVHRSDERRAAEVTNARITAALQATRPAPWGRRWLGTMMIALGTVLAGKATQVNEREATSPLTGSRPALATSR